MKRLALSILAGAALFGATPAFAEPALADPPTAPECALKDIYQHIDDAIAQIRNSPAYGHAKHHYSTAILHLTKVKEQLARGCELWTADQHR